jgi:hypothetical protein
MAVSHFQTLPYQSMHLRPQLSDFLIGRRL